MAAASWRARRAILAWCLYDWAFSAFPTVVTTFVFATYFVRAVAPDPVSGAASWGAAQSAAGLVLAALASPVGALADAAGGRRRLWLGVSAGAMAVCTALLWTVGPAPGFVPRALLLAAVGTVAFELAGIFYNAMLTDVAPQGRIGVVSSLAWGFGYIGGLACLATCLYGLIQPSVPPFGLDRASAEPVRAAALAAAAWTVVFGWPVLIFAPPNESPARRAGLRVIFASAGRALGALWRAAVHDRVLGRFLVARMLYADGLTTLFAFGGIYAAGTFGMGAREVLLLGIALNLAAGVGAILAALIEDRVGPRTVVAAALALMIVFGVAILLVHRPASFWMLACGLGLCIGPAQASSRSFIARIAPPERRNSLFGAYALSGRITGFIAPAALAAVTAASGSQRVGMGVVVVFLAAGLLMLLRVPSPPTDPRRPRA
jgi:UMF1 family MFS transporter